MFAVPPPQAPQGPPHYVIDGISNMYLTEPELDWAWEIQEAIVADSELGAVSDFEIAQLAVVTLGQQEDMHSIRERVLALQCLREEYHIQDDAQEGVHLMGQLTRVQQPGHILAFDKSHDGRNYVGVFDFAANKPSAVKTDADWRVYLGAYYYLLTAACANLTTIREGFVSIVECEGMGFHTFSHSMQQRWAEELGMHFPVETKESMWLHTPLVANLMCSFVKPWMNSRKARWERIKLGCQLDWYDGRIDTLFNIPTVYAAQEKMLNNLYHALSERFYNQRVYRLPPKPIEEEEEIEEGGSEGSMRQNDDDDE